MKDETLEKLREKMKRADDHHLLASDPAAGTTPDRALVHAVLAIDERLAAIMHALIEDETL